MTAPAMQKNAAKAVAWLKAHVADSAHLAMDSRQIGAGDVFFACKGLSADGRQHAAAAVSAGAAAIVAHAPLDDDAGVPVLVLPELAACLGEIADQWYRQPSKDLTVIAVTGTNGKTSTVQWLASALNQENVACGTVGTLGVTLPDGTNLGGALTTPDVLGLHRGLAALRDAGAGVAAIEASSIGIEQGRLSGVRIAFAGFTNLTRDHLDYHLTLEAYREAKLALFRFPGLRGAVVNLDDDTGAMIHAQAVDAFPILGYTVEGREQASIIASELQVSSRGQVFQLSLPDGAAQLVTPMQGAHNVSNLLLVAGLLHLLGWPLQRVARSLARLQPVPGRLQVVDAPFSSGSDPLVVVDYAHTPDALERALLALRETAGAGGGRLICMFGCGGDRDAGKRPLMGAVAARLADRVIVTSDNARFEDPRDIIDQILAGMPQQRPDVIVERAQAILHAVWQARAGDVVLLAGKGHETYQEVRGVRAPFDDREWARAALAWKQAGGVSTDSRSIGPGQIFVALRGESFDGHDYLAQVGEAGALAAVVERRDADAPLPQLALGDTRKALIHLASAWRGQFDIPVIAVTGSNGKTTTKEMIASILRAWVGEDAVLATQGNLNNDIGVPLTVLRLRESHRAAVIEQGMNHPGEIAVLANIAKATVALVNNAQREHQEFMSSVQAVAQENGAVLTALPADGVAVYPGDDAYSRLWGALADGRPRVRFGLRGDLEVHASGIAASADGSAFDLNTPEGRRRIVLPAAGEHNVRNALAAAACAIAAGATLDAVVEGLQAFRPVKGRLQHIRLGDFSLIDDTYNANPDSVRAAIDVLAGLKGETRLVLGDMGEVGDESDAVHAEVGRYARERGVGSLFTLGKAATHAAEAFGAGARAFADREALIQALLEQAPAHILVKGSRFMRMEHVVHALCTHGSKTEIEGT